MTTYHDHLLSMARYHRWAHQRLRERVDEMSEEAYHAEAGIAFDTVHGTLNHMLLVDNLWYHRLREEVYEFDSLTQELESQPEKLWLKLVARADHFIDMLETMGEEYVQTTFTYENSAGLEYENERGQILAHVFNHGTHHRGQISAAMTVLGYEWPKLDYLYFLRD